jgi:hypothetical protein
MHYNDPDIDARDFLYAVMHDASLPTSDRLQAAQALLGVEPNPRFNPPSLLYQIGGLLPPDEYQMMKDWTAFQAEQMSYFRSLPKAEKDEFLQAYKRLTKCNELDVGDVKFMQVKGHA